MRLELSHLNAVDGRSRFAHLPDFLFGHLANPQHPMPLQSGMSEIDGAFIERLVEVAAPDEDKIDEISRKLEQQPFAGVVLPHAHKRIREPRAVAIQETELHRRGRVVAPEVTECLARSL